MSRTTDDTPSPEKLKATSFHEGMKESENTTLIQLTTTRADNVVKHSDSTGRDVFFTSTNPKLSAMTQFSTAASVSQHVELNTISNQATISDVMNLSLNRKTATSHSSHSVTPTNNYRTTTGNLSVCKTICKIHKISLAVF